MATLYDAKGNEIEIPAAGGTTDTGASIATFRKIGIVGDSFASGTVNPPAGGQPSYPALSWGQVIGRISGTTVTNFTTAGLSTRTWLTHANGLAKLLAAEAQGLYILALGINDDNLGADYIGTIADINEDHTLNPDTFYGNYGKIIAQIQDHAPGAKLVMLTLTRKEPLKAQLDAAIAEIAAHFGFPSIAVDEDAFFTTAPFPLSNGHPTIVAHGGMGKAIMRLVERCMVDHVAYFEDYADTGDEGQAE